MLVIPLAATETAVIGGGDPSYEHDARVSDGGEGRGRDRGRRGQERY